MSIEIRNVSKQFGDFHALRDVSLDIDSGELIALLGPSGCGKTTLLRIIAGLARHDSGSVELGGAASALAAGRAIGMVFQQPSLLQWRTVLDNVMLPADILKLPRRAARERALELLRLVGLDARRDDLPAMLSGGMQQRVAIARALLHSPQLVLMDEPFGALDALTREKMQQELLRIREHGGQTFVIVTHSVQEAVFLSSRCVVLTGPPGRVAGVVDIPFGFPRPLALRTAPEFGACMQRIYALLGMG